MPINAVADQYLRAFRENAEFEGGLNFRQALTQSKLDFSVGSLERVDILLDQIRARFAPEPDQFIADQRNVNFLYLLAFYVGEVVVRANGAAIEWLQYDEMIERIPSNRDFFPYCFGSSVTCILSWGTEDGAFFVPLASIEERLYEAEPTKSVAFSAGAFL